MFHTDIQTLGGDPDRWSEVYSLKSTIHQIWYDLLTVVYISELAAMKGGPIIISYRWYSIQVLHTIYCKQWKFGVIKVQ